MIGKRGICYILGIAYVLELFSTLHLAHAFLFRSRVTRTRAVHENVFSSLDQRIQTLYSSGDRLQWKPPHSKFAFFSMLKESCGSSEKLLQVPLKVVSFNVLAPCYKRVPLPNAEEGDKAYCMEAEMEPVFLDRHRNICERLRASSADIICLQEFWSGSESLRDLYLENLCMPSATSSAAPSSAPSAATTPASAVESPSSSPTENSCYSLYVLPRTSHWRSRADSIAVLVRNDKFQVEDVREILFHDCGDRVALMLRVAMRTEAVAAALGLDPQKHHIPAQRFLCINTHLLFPHNQYSTKIRLREMTKILGFVETYKQRELCSTVCGRADVRLPILIAGDFNGSPRGSVYQFTRSQNYKSATEEMWRYEREADAETETVAGAVSVNEDFVRSTSTSTSTAGIFPLPADYSAPASFKRIHNYTNEFFDGQDVHQPSDTVSTAHNNSSTWDKWISHRSHRGQNVPVDHVFYLNPSDQVEEKLPPLPDWTNLVFQELVQRLAQSPFPVLPTSISADSATSAASATGDDSQALTQAASEAAAAASETARRVGTTIRQVFAHFDQDNSNFISREEFASALKQLGFIGEGTPCLTDEEIDVLVRSADRNNDGMIDYKEFYDRFWLATAASAIVPLQSSGDTNSSSSSSSSATTRRDSRILSAEQQRLLQEQQQQLALFLLQEEQPQQQTGNDGMDSVAAVAAAESSAGKQDATAVGTAATTAASAGATAGVSRKVPSTGLMNNRRLAFARSDWLSEQVTSVGGNTAAAGTDAGKFSSSTSTSATTTTSTPSAVAVGTDGSVVAADPAAKATATLSAAVCSNTVISYGGAPIGRESILDPKSVEHMGDLNIAKVSLFPKVLEEGEWPSDFTLSDHGILECLFYATVNGIARTAS